MKLKLIIVIVIASIIIITMSIRNYSEKEIAFNESEIITNIFDKNNITGTFVIYNPKNKILTGYNSARAKEQFIPGSTFKIANAYIALSENAITNIDDIFYIYDGSDLFLESWEKDSSLRDAIKNSNVPAFKQLARKMGLEVYQNYLTNYGNSLVGTVVDDFWLEGPLMASAIEQALYLNGIIEEDSQVMPLLKEILFQEEINGYKLYAKTGWAKEIGWFVGWIEKEDAYYPFAFNMDLSDSKLLPMRETITKEILLAIDLNNLK